MSKGFVLIVCVSQRGGASSSNVLRGSGGRLLAMFEIFMSTCVKTHTQAHHHKCVDTSQGQAYARSVPCGGKALSCLFGQGKQGGKDPILLHARKRSHAA